ncbi:MAG: protein phosphatase 2C domain-containing protein [Xanthomonadales bacterium]|nr:protein phosphatase 2C domain-containing protein [Xanthomonadales bacterium]
MGYHFDFGHVTGPGAVRDRNEDAYSFDLAEMIWVVADGMGGKSRGDLASRIAAMVVKNKAAEDADLVSAIQAGNAAIKLAGQRYDGAGMATTIVALLIDRDINYELAWVGDSRAYLWQDGELKALTRDHSFVQELLDAGVLTTEEAETHPQRNVVTRSLGNREDHKPDVDSVQGRLVAGNRILLCTDGLTSELDDEEINRQLSSGDSAQRTAESLMQKALDSGGKDNITVLIIDIVDKGAR